MTEQHLNEKAADTKFDVQAKVQKQKMDQAVTTHAGKIKGDAEPNAKGAWRDAGDCKGRINDGATNRGE